MRSKLSGISAVVLIVVFLTGCDPADFAPSDRFTADFHYTLKPPDRLSVEDSNGEIEIAGWDEPTIEVTGVRFGPTQEALDSVKIDIHESSAFTEIRATHPNGFHGSPGARFLIHAPRKTVTDRIVSSNGLVRVHDMTANTRVHTSNGAVRVENVRGDVDATTSNGSINLDTVSGQLSLRTSNGHIEGQELTGACEAETSNGPVTLRFKAAPEGAVRVHTSNGAVEMTMAKAPKEGIRVQTSTGSIQMELPGDTSARVNAEASQSNVSSDFEISGSSENRDKKHLEGSIGTGGPLIELTTHNGGIHIRKSSAAAN